MDTIDVIKSNNYACYKNKTVDEFYCVNIFLTDLHVKL